MPQWFMDTEIELKWRSLLHVAGMRLAKFSVPLCSKGERCVDEHITCSADVDSQTNEV